MTVTEPTMVGTATTAKTANTVTDTSLSAALPSTAGGVLQRAAISASNGTATAPTINWPAGWLPLPGYGYVTDGAAPQLGGGIWWKFHEAGVDPTSLVLNFPGGANVAVEVESWAGVDPHRPFSEAFQGPYLGTTTAKAASGITTVAEGRVGYVHGDRSGGGYTGATGTVRGSVANSGGPAVYAQDDSATIGAQSRALTGPSTSVGWFGIYRLNPAAPSPAQPLSGWLGRTKKDVAHRVGGSTSFPPEMSFQAAQKSIAYGAQALELSVWRTSDGVWVCSHDRSTLRMTGVDLDIPGSTWATLSALTTTIGGYPLNRLQDFLDVWGADQHVWFIENKQGVNDLLFLDFLDGYAGSTNRFVVKGPYNSNTTRAARARGYTTWGYWYSADLSGLATYGYNTDLVGMDYSAAQGDWDSLLALGLPTLGHVCLSSAAATMARSKGANGVMTGLLAGVMDASGGTVSASGSGSLALVGVIPGNEVLARTGAGALTLAGTATAAGALALSGSGGLGGGGGPAPKQTLALAGVGALAITRPLSTGGTLALSGSGQLIPARYGWDLDVFAARPWTAWSGGDPTAGGQYAMYHGSTEFIHIPVTGTPGWIAGATAQVSVDAGTTWVNAEINAASAAHVRFPNGAAGQSADLRVLSTALGALAVGYARFLVRITAGSEVAIMRAGALPIT